MVHKSPVRKEDMDEFYYFGMHVAAQLRALPTNEALEFEVEIQSMLTNKRLNSVNCDYNILPRTISDDLESASMSYFPDNIQCETVLGHSSTLMTPPPSTGSAQGEDIIYIKEEIL